MIFPEVTEVLIQPPAETLVEIQTTPVTIELSPIGSPGPPGPTGDSNFEIDPFVITSQDLINKYVTLSKTPNPLKLNKTEACLQYAPTQTYAIDYYVDGNKLKWDGLAFELLLEVGTIMTVKYFT